MTDVCLPPLLPTFCCWTDRCSLSLIVLLRNPFADHHCHWHDAFRLETLLCMTEKATFVLLRSSFDDAYRRGPRQWESASGDATSVRIKEAQKRHSDRSPGSRPPPLTVPGLNNDSNGQSLARHGKFHISLRRFKNAKQLKNHNEQCRPAHRVQSGAVLGRRSSAAARNRVAPEVRRQQRLERRELKRAGPLHHHATFSLLTRRTTTNVKKNDAENDAGTHERWSDV